MHEEIEPKAATRIAQRVAELRRLVAGRWPFEGQVAAMAALVNAVRPFCPPGTVRTHVRLLLAVAEAQDALAVGTTIPNTAEELEAIFKRLPHGKD